MNQMSTGAIPKLVPVGFEQLAGWGDDNHARAMDAFLKTAHAMNEGAYDYVPKPFDKDELLATIAKALELRTIEHEKKQLDDAPAIRPANPKKSVSP